MCRWWCRWWKASNILQSYSRSGMTHVLYMAYIVSFVDSWRHTMHDVERNILPVLFMLNWSLISWHNRMSNILVLVFVVEGYRKGAIPWGGKFEGSRSVQGSWNLWKRVPGSLRKALPIHLFSPSCYRVDRLATMHSITDRRTNKRFLKMFYSKWVLIVCYRRVTMNCLELNYRLRSKRGQMRVVKT